MSIGGNYIDPGTGSMLFTLLIGVGTTGYFFARKLFINARFALTGGSGKTLGDGRHPFVIFSDDKRYWNVFKPICDEFEQRGIELAYWTASPDDPALDESYEHVSCEFIGEENKAFARLNMMEADVVLATTPGLDVYQWKRSKGVGFYVHTFHTVGTALGYRMFGMDYFDAVLLAGDYQIDEIRTVEHARGIPEKELVTVGSTYLDVMAMRRLRELAEENDDDVPVVELPTDQDGEVPLTVLLAPSWGPNAILSVYGERIIDALLDTGFNLVIRPHPQSKTSDRDILDALMEKYPDDERVEWNFDVDNFDCLSRADIMITDFSGVIYDYVLVFDRPVIYTPANYDDSLYDAAWYDKPQWRFETYPSFGVALDEADFPRLREVIESTIADEGLAAGRAKARAEAWAHPGEAAMRTVDYLVGCRERILAAEAEEAQLELAEGTVGVRPELAEGAEEERLELAEGKQPEETNAETVDENEAQPATATSAEMAGADDAELSPPDDAATEEPTEELTGEPAEMDTALSSEEVGAQVELPAAEGEEDAEQADTSSADDQETDDTADIEREPEAPPVHAADTEPDSSPDEQAADDTTDIVRLPEIPPELAVVMDPEFGRALMQLQEEIVGIAIETVEKLPTLDDKTARELINQLHALNAGMSLIHEDLAELNENLTGRSDDSEEEPCAPSSSIPG